MSRRAVGGAVGELGRDEIAQSPGERTSKFGFSPGCRGKPLGDSKLR